jgi:hypothetical protein
MSFSKLFLGFTKSIINSFCLTFLSDLPSSLCQLLYQKSLSIMHLVGYIYRLIYGKRLCLEVGGKLKDNYLCDS